MSVSLALPGGSPALYTIGGTRFWFNRLSDALASPVRYEGWKDMGNVVDDNFEEEKDELDHHSSRHGTRKRDRSLVSFPLGSPSLLGLRLLRSRRS